MATEPRLRTATLDDVDALVALIESAYRGDASRAGWTTEADLLGGRRTDATDLRACLARPRSRVLVADEGAAPIACAHVMVDDGAGYFGMFAVAPGRQGGGLGGAVLAEAERIVRDDWRLPAMRMTVIDVRTELIAYYQRRGYVRTGVHRPFPYGDARFGQPKRPDLRFEILEKRLGPDA